MVFLLEFAFKSLKCIEGAAKSLHIKKNLIHGLEIHSVSLFFLVIFRYKKYIYFKLQLITKETSFGSFYFACLSNSANRRKRVEPVWTSV